MVLYIFVLMACSCAAHNNASVPIFQSLLDNHCQVLSLQTFSGISLTNCPCIFFSFFFCLNSCAFCFLNSPLVTVTLYSNSLDEVFFRIGNIKTQIIFLFSNVPHSSDLYLPLSSLRTTVHIALRV